MIRQAAFSYRTFLKDW